MPGVASLQVNGNYYGALQLGAYLELCLPVGTISVAARMTQVGGEIKDVYDSTTTLSIEGRVSGIAANAARMRLEFNDTLGLL